MQKQQIRSLRKEPSNYFCLDAKVVKKSSAVTRAWAPVVKPNNQAARLPSVGPCGQTRPALQEVVVYYNGSVRLASHARKPPRRQARPCLACNLLTQGCALSMAVFCACKVSSAQLLCKPTTSLKGRGNVAPWGRPEGARWPGCRASQQLPERMELNLIFCLLLYQAKSNPRFPGREQWRLA